MITTSDFSELKNSVSSIFSRLADFEHNLHLLVEGVLDLAATTIAWTFYALPIVVFVGLSTLCYLIPNGPIYFWLYLYRPWLKPVLVYLVNSIYFYFFVNAIYFEQNLTTAFWIAFTLFYGTTFNDSHNTGSRSSPTIRGMTRLWDLFVRYFDYKVISDAKLDKDKTYLYGFHPHGIYPYSIIWGPLTSVWKNKFPGITFEPLGATLLFLIPMVRDIAMWLGGRDVTRKSINYALKNNQSIALVPGGQAEMRESRSCYDEVVILRRHKGFVRVALENGADLVPMYCFGETGIFDNIYLPTIQSWFLRKIGFGYPLFPYGKYYLPVPRPCPMRLIIGEPIPVTRVPQPTEEQVNELHKKYFDSLEALIEKHKVECGYPKASIKFKDD